jgi:pilus assembly protein Flp/PilA
VNAPGFERGQGLVEYALILVLVAVVVLAVLLILGPILGNTFSEVNSEIERVSYVLQLV